MSEISIRPALLNELPILLEFEQLIIEHERPFDENLKAENAHYSDVEQIISSKDALVLVAECNNKLVGSGYALIRKALSYVNEDYHSFLGLMYVDPNYRRQGINQLIIEKLIDWSQSRGITVISLEVLNNNAAAVNAYSNLGFSINLVEMRMNLKD